ncbi:MAG: succinate dehydrogenase cytochrome b subunit [Gemmataceae bacterium]|nr:succinate dehydrogenase cytochrome b subunit [Gemmataceae bacterium]MCI0743272.1 succinate dehydrogenase cytochrome b subunit [Gemmataceae bacterium]
MPSSVPTKRQLTPNSLPPGKGLLAWTLPVFSTTVGSKLLVGVTGAALTAFVIVHLIGNLKIFSGPDSINSYAKFLKDLGPLLWIMRFGLLFLFVLHIVLAIRLKLRSRSARPVPYVSEATIQASVASRTMIVTGLAILAYVVFHVAHFTLGWVQSVEITPGIYTNMLDLRDVEGRADVYTIMIYGFRNPLVSILYLAAQGFLFVHLSHGVASTFQTFGANSPRWQPAIRALGWAVAIFVCVGNSAIVLAVWTGYLKPLI